MPGNAPAERKIAARIDGEPIYADEALHEFNRAFGMQPVDEVQRPMLLARSLEQVIDRRLVLGYLEQSGQGVSAEDIDFAVAQLEKDLKSQGLTLDGHLQQVGLRLPELRRSVAWKLSWHKYLERFLTDDNLQKYFDKHRRDFDGTQVRAAHILLKVPPIAEAAELKTTEEKALAIRQQIVDNKQTFATAATEHSQAPTAQEGGDIGWIERHQPMPPAFSRAAFALEKGQVSEPVRSPAGIHLITVLEVKPGSKSRPAVDAELRPAVTLYLFRRIADKERAKVKIEYEPSLASEPKANESLPPPR